jgi:hypothetical protein
MILMGMILAAVGGCEPQPPPVRQMKYDQYASAKKAMELFDTNKDGVISGDELDKTPGLNAALTVLGTDREKGVNPEQIEKRIKSWIKSKIGRQTVSCSVYRNGEPLSGAKIKFLPEPFLPEIKDIGEGKTSTSGMAMITWPTTQGPNGLPPGIGPGIYRVEITKDGEDIPAKYNTETILGQEISQDNIELQKGLRYDLSY